MESCSEVFTTLDHNGREVFCSYTELLLCFEEGVSSPLVLIKIHINNKGEVMEAILSSISIFNNLSAAISQNL